MEIFFFITGLLLGLIIANIYYRTVILSQMERHYVSLLEKYARESEHERRPTNTTPTNILAQQILFDSENLVDISYQTYEHTEKLRRQVRNQLLARQDVS
jgi:hypothetical protein